MQRLHDWLSILLRRHFVFRTRSHVSMGLWLLIIIFVIHIQMHTVLVCLYHYTIDYRTRGIGNANTTAIVTSRQMRVTVHAQANMAGFLHPSWRAKPASWGVLRLFWITCVYIYIYIYICLCAPQCLSTRCIGNT